MNEIISIAIGIGIVLCGLTAWRHVFLNWRKAAVYGAITAALITVASLYGPHLNR